MIPKYWSVIWAAVAPAVANHLWQSTVFAVIAALLTLTLRKNQARARYWLWLAASVKFLIPFSLLVVAGSYLARPSAELRSAPAGGLYAAIEELAPRFIGAAFLAIPSYRPQSLGSTDSALPAHLIPVMLGVVWLCGFLAVLFAWWLRWRRMSGALRGATPLREGREVEALRRLERIAPIRKPVPIFLSRAHLEPGIFGIVQPVLVWPEGISERLDDAQLDAILAHEMWHVQHRDNLAAAMHILVEAVFWFHPLVWWLGARLIEERERACDEAVLQLGNKPQAYAESILKTCEFCVGSPLACVSGVTGADLKKRIVRIMTQRAARRLDLRRKLLLGMAGFLAVAVPIGFGLARPRAELRAATAGEDATATAPKFEVASIKPAKFSGRRMFFAIKGPPNDGRFYATNVTLKLVLRLAYDVQGFQIVGGPSWITSERFDIQAKSDSAVNDYLRKLSPSQGRLVKGQMVQALLADRFKLKLHRETKKLPVYDLIVTKHGPKLQESKGASSGPFAVGGHALKNSFRIQFGGANRQISAQDASMSFLAQALSQQLGRTVLDNTGLKGNYNFTLKWTADVSRGQMFPGPGPGGPVKAGAGAGSAAGMPPAPGSSAPSIFTAIQEQLGLKLKSEKGPVEVLVIDHVAQPTPN